MPSDVPQILLIEEEAILAEITQFRLQLLGYDVTTMTTAEDALEWLGTNSPDMIMVDRMVSGMEGLDFLNRISNDERTADIPVMLLSSSADLDNVQQAYNAGADEFVVVPYDPLVLERKVEALLEKQTAG